MSKATNTAQVELCRRHAEDLGEHFDAVQILASQKDDGNTALVAYGVGNLYARQGMAHVFAQTILGMGAK